MLVRGLWVNKPLVMWIFVNYKLTSEGENRFFFFFLSELNPGSIDKNPIKSCTTMVKDMRTMQIMWTFLWTRHSENMEDKKNLKTKQYRWLDQTQPTFMRVWEITIKLEYDRAVSHSITLFSLKITHFTIKETFTTMILT